MNAKFLMTLSSVFMGLLGLPLCFMPSEVIKTFEQGPNITSTLTLQLAGAVYFGFAVTNWMAKGVLIGGVYARPLAIGNFSHFIIAGLARANISLKGIDTPSYVYVLTIIYTLFAIPFVYVLFKHPFKNQ